MLTLSFMLILQSRNLSYKKEPYTEQPDTVQKRGRTIIKKCHPKNVCATTKIRQNFVPVLFLFFFCVWGVVNGQERYQSCELEEFIARTKFRVILRDVKQVYAKKV